MEPTSNGLGVHSEQKKTRTPLRRESKWNDLIVPKMQPALSYIKEVTVKYSTPREPPARPLDEDPIVTRTDRQDYPRGWVAQGIVTEHTKEGQ